MLSSTAPNYLLQVDGTVQMQIKMNVWNQKADCIIVLCVTDPKMLKDASCGDGGIKVFHFGKLPQPCSVDLMVSLYYTGKLKTK